MLTLTATVLNVFQAPEGVNKDGDKYGGGFKVQFQAENTLKNGETRIELLTLSAKDPRQFEQVKGKKVHVSVGAFVSGRQIQFYIPEKFTVRLAA